MKKTVLKPQLWTHRPVEETIAVYQDWAEDYDSDLAERGYQTPTRLVAELAEHVSTATRILDYGCGTGISGAALRAAGFHHLHGTDVTAEMLDLARPKGIYEKLWHSAPGAPPPQSYGAIVAIGVISLGAAPPETLDLLIGALDPGGVLALSFNDPTLEDGSYDARLDALLATGAVTLLSRNHGPHLEDIGMGSDVIVLRHP